MARDESQFNSLKLGQDYSKDSSPTNNNMFGSTKVEDAAFQSPSTFRDQYPASLLSAGSSAGAETVDGAFKSSKNSSNSSSECSPTSSRIPSQQNRGASSSSSANPKRPPSVSSVVSCGGSQITPAKSTPSYLQELLRDKKQLQSIVAITPNLFQHMDRLLDEGSQSLLVSSVFHKLFPLLLHFNFLKKGIRRSFRISSNQKI